MICDINFSVSDSGAWMAVSGIVGFVGQVMVGGPGTVPSVEMCLGYAELLWGMRGCHRVFNEKRTKEVQK